MKTKFFLKPKMWFKMFLDLNLYRKNIFNFINHIFMLMVSTLNIDQKYKLCSFSKIQSQMKVLSKFGQKFCQNLGKNFVKNCSSIKIRAKIKIFVENWTFDQKAKLLSKIEISVKNYKFGSNQIWKLKLWS